MKVVNIKRVEAGDGDGAVVVGEFVQFCFLLAPVEGGLPGFCQAFDVCERGAVIPCCAVEFIWEFGLSELDFESDEFLFGDVDAIG